MVMVLLGFEVRLRDVGRTGEVVYGVLGKVSYSL